MSYLFIKEIAEKTSAEEVIIIVSTLLKDLNSDNELFRANSLRVLSRILDVGFFSVCSSVLSSLANGALHQASHRPQEPHRGLLRPPVRSVSVQRQRGLGASVGERDQSVAELRGRDGAVPRPAPPPRDEAVGPTGDGQGRHRSRVIPSSCLSCSSECPPVLCRSACSFATQCVCCTTTPRQSCSTPSMRCSSSVFDTPATFLLSLSLTIRWSLLRRLARLCDSPTSAKTTSPPR